MSFSLDYEQEYVDETGQGVKCEKCGGTYGSGDYPFCKGYPESHGKMGGHNDPFTPHVDIQLLDRNDPRCTGVNELGIRGVPLTSRGDRARIMKEQGLQFGTQKFDEKRGKVLYGGAATSNRFKSHQGPGHRKAKKQSYE